MNKLLSLTFLCCLLLFDLVARAQTPVQVGTGTSASGANVLFSTNTGGNLWSKSASLYTATEINNAGGASGNITKIAFNKQGTGEYTFGDAHLSIYIKAVTKTDQSGASLNWPTNLGNATLVYTSTTQSFMLGTGWQEFNLQTPFLWDGSSNLEVITAFHHPTTLTANMTWQYTVATNMNMSRVNSNQIASETMFLQSNRPNIQFTIVPSTPCITPPTPGTASASSSTVCPNIDFNLSVSGSSFGSGQTFQWESSPTGSAPWTPIGTPSMMTNLTRSQTSTTYYRLAVTCSGQTAYTNTVQVSTNATPLASVYTIDQNSPASASNFVSFTSLINELVCRGVSAPVTFNVVAGSGPYNEKVTVPAIPGTSATNTVTFNGNGNTVISNLASSTDALVTLDGAKYIRFNNLNFNTASSTTGIGVNLTNGAQFNNFVNNTITLSTTATGTSYGIRLHTGANNDNVFQDNTIIGGYYGLYSYGASGAILTGNNFINNEFRDPYYYGMYLYYTNNSVVEGNEIHRPTRTAGTTFYCLYGSSSNSLTINKNRIHNITTATIYGIYNTGSDSPVGSPTVVKNNLIYNLNNTGSTYAIYNSGSDGVHYYHNTVSIDDQTSATGLVRGFYQLTAASNIRFINNNISITRPTSGAVHALYFGTTTSTIVSNNNNLYAPAGNVGYYSTAYPTLTNWRTANSSAYDQNSVSANPVYIDLANGNLRPNTVALDNMGQAGTGVTDDILGNPRATIPDLGAYELSVPANDVAITDISGPVSGCGLSATETITITIRNFGSATQTNTPVSYSINGTQTGTGTWNGTLAPNATATFTFTQTADLSVQGAYMIEAETGLSTDTNTTNDSYSINIGNSLLPALPVAFDFETPANGIGAMRVVTNSNSNITEGAAASNGAGSAKGMIMDGVNSAQWEIPAGILNPWTTNPDHFAAVYLCLTPNATQQDSLILTFDLKQLYKGSNLNTNFRVTANGQQIGSTYNPPFTGWGTGGATWQHIRVDLSQFANSSSLEIGLESSVKEEYANGNGTANLIDNINLYRVQNPKTGVKDNLLQSLANVYPNPSNGIFNVSLSQGKAYALEVTDLTGKTILKAEGKNQQAQLNLQGKAKGIYILKIASEGQIATRKLIVE